MTNDEYKNKLNKIEQLSKTYYNGVSEATDEEYDKLVTEVKKYEKDNNLNSSVLNTVGYEVSDKSRSVRRNIKMYSLDNVFNEEELDKWIASIKKKLNIEDIDFVVSPKFDGCSLDCVYKDGILVLSSTRGNGDIGLNITDNAKTIATVPKELKNNNTLLKLDCSIRGEVIVKKSIFKSINSKLKSNGKTEFSNPRNYVSGSLNLLDSSIVKDRLLDFIPWGICGIKSKNYYEDMKLVYSLNGIIPYFTYFKLCKTAKEVKEHIQNIYSRRENMSVNLDGCVVTLNNTELQSKLGWTVKVPRFSIAYKFPPTEVSTKLIGVDNQVANTGTITPVGLLQPVILDGRTIKKVTLHNYNYILEKDIRVGDTVSIILSGDVIPKLVRVFKDRRTGDEKKIELITKCPICSNEIISKGAKLICVECKKK